MEFSDKKLEDYWSGSPYPKNISPEIRKLLSNKLLTLDAATSIEQLSIPPSNNLEKLSGNYEGYYSIQINKQYRLVFRWGKEGAAHVTCTNYH